MTNQVGQQRGVLQDVADMSINKEFLRMNPQSFTSSSVTEDFENFVEDFERILRLSYH